MGRKRRGWTTTAQNNMRKAKKSVPVVTDDLKGQLVTSDSRPCKKRLNYGVSPWVSPDRGFVDTVLSIPQVSIIIEDTIGESASE